MLPCQLFARPLAAGARDWLPPPCRWVSAALAGLQLLRLILVFALQYPQDQTWVFVVLSLARCTMWLLAILMLQGGHACAETATWPASARHS